MEKIVLLLNEFNRMKKTNFIKFVLIILFILAIGLGSFITTISLQTKWIILIFSILLVGLMIFLNAKKQNIIIHCQNEYQQNPQIVCDKLEARKKYYLDVFDFTNETLVFKEMIRILNSYQRYHDKGKIGPWEILYNHHKTENFYKKLELKNKMSIQKARGEIENLPLEIKDMLNQIGVDYHKIYDIWENKFSKSKEDFELMYPVFGFILNDSQVLHHGLKFKQYEVNEDTLLKPYERQLFDEDIIMIHIKTNLRGGKNG